MERKRTDMNDRLDIHEAFASKLRIILITALISGEKTFTELKKISGATDGNLSVQLSKLEKWGFVGVEKAFEGKKPRTTCSLTTHGRSEFEKYVAALEAVLKQPEA